MLWSFLIGARCPLGLTAWRHNVTQLSGAESGLESSNKKGFEHDLTDGCHRPCSPPQRGHWFVQTPKVLVRDPDKVAFDCATVDVVQGDLSDTASVEER